MKKVLYFIAVIALATLSSCSNECTCTTKATGPGSENHATTTYTYSSKSCSDGNVTLTQGDLTLTTVCK